MKQFERRDKLVWCGRSIVRPPTTSAAWAASNRDGGINGTIGPQRRGQDVTQSAESEHWAIWKVVWTVVYSVHSVSRPEQRGVSES